MTGKLQIIAIFLYCLSCSKNESFDSSLILGRWEAKNKVIFEFFENDKCSLNLPYKNFSQNMQGIFSINNSKNVKTIDIKKIKGISYSFYGIFDLVNENVIKISKFSTSQKTRPISFEKNNFLILQRKEINGSD